MPTPPEDPRHTTSLDGVLASVLRRSRLGIVVLAGDASVVWANGSALQMLPALDPKRQGASLSDVVDVKAAGADWTRVTDALATRRSLPVLELPLRNGRWLGIELQALPKDIADPRPAAALALQDVTQRRLARERERVEGELKLQARQLGRIGAWEYDVASDKVRWSDEMFAIHGLTPVAEPDMRIFVPLYDAASRDRWLSAFQAVVGSGQGIDVELDLVTPQGDARHLHAIGRPLWRDRRVVGIAGLIHDTTAASAARQAIAELRDRLRLTTQAIGAGIWEWDFGTGRISWDEQMYRLYGLPHGGVIDEAIWAHTIHPEDFVRARDTTRAVISGRFDHIDHHFRIVWPDGQVRHIQSVGSRIDTPQGRRLVGINFDVTDREHHAQALLDQQAAERASRAKSELLSRASHELRTPMNAVLGFAQLLQLRAGELPRWAGDAVHQLRQAGTHLLALIDDLLDLAAVEAGTVPLQTTSVSLDDTIGAATDLLRPQALSAGVVLGHWARSGVHVLADATRVRQVLLNLLGNAIKYNRPGGRVDVLLEPLVQPDQHVDIVVRDDGPGIAPERHHQLFEPFNRLGAQGGGVSGHGLGLAISRQLALAMHGTLELHCAPGAGTEAVLRLPLAAGVANASAAPASGPDTPPAPAAAVRVLCIEDNPVNAFLMREALALRTGAVELRMADSGERGLEVLASWRPDLVLLDMTLPGIDGHEVLRRMRAQPALADLPCVAVSANAMPPDIARARAAGFDDYWVKPFDVATLTDRVLQYAPARVAR